MSAVLASNNQLNDTGKGGVKVLVVTGASGGHIFPALSFLTKLKDKYKEIDTLFVLPKRSRRIQKIPDSSKLSYISISPISLSFDFRNFISILGFLKGTLESLILLLRFRPDVVVGFGSLDCIPLVMLAWVFRIKTLIHEQNVIPGRANRLLAKFADTTAISFAETRDYLRISQDRIALTGNPIRQELKRIDKFKALSFFGFDDDKFTILVMGGSLGSHRINAGFLKAISLVSDKSKLQVIHLTGIKDYASIKDGYKDLNINAKIFSFLDSMQYAYSACDLVISRAGATTITEIVFFELPAILIPYPYAYRHQLNNAEVLERKGCAFIVKDEESDRDILKNTIELFVNEPLKISNMRFGYRYIQIPNAADLLVNEVISLQER